MQTYRLKYIVIVILLLLNLFLCFLLFSYRQQDRQSRRQLIQGISQLYEESQVLLTAEIDLDTAPLPPLSLTRNTEGEAEIAEFFLGAAGSAADQGGGIHLYSRDGEQMLVRSSGAFDYVAAQPRAADPAALCREFCQSFGYRAVEMPSGSSGSFLGMLQIDGHDVYNCMVSIFLEDGMLISAAGSWVSTQDAAPLYTARITAADALVKFLDYRNTTGLICSRVEGILPVYELLSSTSGPSQLSSKWEITTDTHQYYVDCKTGLVSRS